MTRSFKRRAFLSHKKKSTKHQSQLNKEKSQALSEDYKELYTYE